MKNFEIPKDLRGAQLVEWLEHTSDSQNDEKYFRGFDQAELDDARRQFSDLSLKLSDRNDAFNEVKKEHALICKEIKKDISDTIKAVRLRGIEETGRCYMFKDFEKLMVTTVNRFGSIINQRAMTPEEKQTTIGSGIMRNMAVGQ